MIITHYGAECFKIQVGDLVVAYNPISKDAVVKASRFGSDVALVAANHPLCNGIEQVSYSEKKPFVISGPGEYEVKDVFIKGLASEHKLEGDVGINTIYLVQIEGVHLCFLGALSTTKIPAEAIEAMGEVDVVFVPIGGKPVLSPSEAYKFAVSLEPNVIIPMHCHGIGEKDALEHFMKEAGSKSTAVDKFTFKKKDIDGKSGEIVIIEPAKS